MPHIDPIRNDDELLFRKDPDSDAYARIIARLYVLEAWKRALEELLDEMRTTQRDILAEIGRFQTEEEIQKEVNKRLSKAQHKAWSKREKMLGVLIAIVGSLGAIPQAVDGVKVLIGGG